MGGDFFAGRRDSRPALVLAPEFALPLILTVAFSLLASVTPLSLFYLAMSSSDLAQSVVADRYVQDVSIVFGVIDANISDLL